MAARYRRRAGRAPTVAPVPRICASCSPARPAPIISTSPSCAAAELRVATRRPTAAERGRRPRARLRARGVARPVGARGAMSAPGVGAGDDAAPLRRSAARDRRTRTDRVAAWRAGRRRSRSRSSVSIPSPPPAPDVSRGALDELPADLRRGVAASAGTPGVAAAAGGARRSRGSSPARSWSTWAAPPLVDHRRDGGGARSGSPGGCGLGRLAEEPPRGR